MNNLINDEIKIVKSKITAPKGFLAGGIHSGIKKYKKDLSIIYSKVPALCSAVYTKNVVKAPPLLWCESLTKNNEKIQAIVINSGNANACTGERGYNDALLTAETLSDTLSIPKKSVMVTSTGVIGVYLPVDKIVKGIKELAPKLSDDDESAQNCALGILTTDTFKKEITLEVDIKNTKVTISGIAKGSGMIHPNMATMLNFITTDINIEKELLDEAFKSNIDDTFNMITVDGETSTNDMAVILANGMANNPVINKKDEDYEKFKKALFIVTKELAKDIVKDGEGASKLIECKVAGTKTKQEARVLVKAILNSNLVKTAFFGEDANWGRVISSMGATGIDFDPNKTTIDFESKKGTIRLFENGSPVIFNEEYALEILKEKEIKVLIRLTSGNFEAVGWGCDLSYDYVKINAEYRS